MKKYNVLHVSPTPLVDSPRKISDALNLYTDFNSTSFIFNDYPGSLKGIFSSKTIIFNQRKDLSLDFIRNADIIHIHNFLYPEQEEILFENSKDDVKFIYQVHSPLREGPNFVNYIPEKIQFDKKCVISQYHPRLYSDHILVPNIILEKPSINLLQDDEKIKLLFSPAHKRTGGRWNDKYSEELIQSLTLLEKFNKIELYIAEGFTPHELFQLRRNCHISIDEIITGGFHQISLESLFTGNMIINNSDIFSNLIFDININNNELNIPFFKMSNFDVKDILFELVNNRDLIREYQNKSYEYSTKYLQPEVLIKHYEKIYKDVINAVI